MAKGVVDTVFGIVEHSLKEREKQRRKEQAAYERYLAKLDKQQQIAAGEEAARLYTVKLLSKFDEYEHDVIAAYRSRSRFPFERGDEAMDVYIRSLVKHYRIDADFIEKDFIGFNDFTDTVILESEVEDKDDIFYAGSYKFMKGSSTLEEVNMKASEKTERYRNLVTVILRENIKMLMQHGVSNAVVNLYRDNIYLASCKVNTKDFQSGKYEEDIRVFKTLSTGVQAYDYLWMRGCR